MSHARVRASMYTYKCICIYVHMYTQISRASSRQLMQLITNPITPEALATHAVSLRGQIFNISFTVLQKYIPHT